MLTEEEFKNIFINIKDILFEDCIKEESNYTFNYDINNKRTDYKEVVMTINKNITDLIKEYDEYLQISDVINGYDFEKALKEVYFDEINNTEYLSTRWFGLRTTCKCYFDYDGNIEKIKQILLNKLDDLKEKYIENLCNHYNDYVKAYEIKKDYIEFAEKIKNAGFKLCDTQRRGDIRVPCTFMKEIDSLTLYVRKNISNYRIYLKCDVGGRYGMTVEEFDKSYQILKREEANIRNALMGENII